MGHRNLGRGQSGVKYGFGLNENRNCVLNLLRGGTFTRASEGSYLISAPTDGSTAFLAWAAINERRIENRGDGNGSMILMEGSRTNIIAAATAVRDLASGPGQGTNTAAQSLSPDGVLSGALCINSTLQYGQYLSCVVGVSGTQYVGSAYVRAAGLTTHNGNFYDDAGLTAVTLSPASRTITSLWQRIDATRTAEHAFLRMIPVCGLVSPGATGPAVAVNAYEDCYQIETGQFPTSFIRGAATTRSSDVLSYPAGQYPTSFGTRGFAFDFAPDFLVSDLGPNVTPFLINGMDAGSANDGVLLSYNILGQPRLFVDNVTKFTGIFTWSARRQKIRVEIRPNEGTITISGATTGNGVHSIGAWSVPCDWPMYIGCDQSSRAAFAYYGGISTTIEGL